MGGISVWLAMFSSIGWLGIERLGLSGWTIMAMHDCSTDMLVCNSDPVGMAELTKVVRMDRTSTDALVERTIRIAGSCGDILRRSCARLQGCVFSLDDIKLLMYV